MNPPRMAMMSKTVKKLMVNTRCVKSNLRRIPIVEEPEYEGFIFIVYSMSVFSAGVQMIYTKIEAETALT